MKTKIKPFYLYAPITRLDDEERIVEGYVYVNAVCGDGIDLTREAMENATPDYLRWGAVREMHQMIAAGSAIEIIWDDYGARIRAHIVDDAAWKKVKAGVYKAFSIGIRAITMRGNKVLSCEWIENSLVDRPADPDAVLTTWRADGIDPHAEYEVEILPENADEPTQGTIARMENETNETGAKTPVIATPVTAAAETSPESSTQAPITEATTARSDVAVDAPDTVTVEVTVIDEDGAGAKDFAQTIADYNETIDANQVLDSVYSAIYTLFDVLDTIYFSEATDKAGAMKTSIQQFADYLATLVGADAASDAVRSIDFKSLITRLKSTSPTSLTNSSTNDPAKQTELTAVQRALETATADKTRISADLAAAKGDVQRLQGEVERLKKTPTVNAPVRFPHAVAREFAANAEASDSSKAVELLRSEYAQLRTSISTEPDEKKRADGVSKLNSLKMTLQALGAGVE